MSDKTKRLRDDAENRRRFDEQVANDAAKGDQQARCLCGLTCYETTIWAITEDRGRPTVYRCPVCLPKRLRDLLGAP